MNEQRKMGLISASEIARIGFAPRADPLAGAGDVCLARHHGADPAARRCAGACAPTGCTTRCGSDASPRSCRQQKNIDEIARELVARAVEIDGNDNTTAQVIRVRSVEQVGMYRGRPYGCPPDEASAETTYDIAGRSGGPTCKVDEA